MAESNARSEPGRREAIGRWLVPGGALRSALVERGFAACRPETLPPGSRYGPFQIEALIGRGATGEVYRAIRQGEGYRQQVALKRLRPFDPLAGVADELFRREIAILAALDHPGIARLIDAGQGPDGARWVAMEYVDGKPIDAYVREAATDRSGVVRLVREVAGAIAHAHGRLVVHRDIKPANVLVDSAGRPRVLDFGIAALIDAEADHGPTLDVATPRYASPEQLRGERPGVESDVYQVGLLLGELLQATAKGAAGDEDLAAIVRRATAPDAARRYPTMLALIDDLDRWMSRRPVLARPPTTAYRLRRFAARHRWPVTIAAVASGAFVAALALSFWQIDAARRDAERARARAERIGAYLVDVFNQASPFVSRGREPTVQDILDAGAARLASGLADEPSVEGEIASVLARVYMTLQRYDRAAGLLERAVALGRVDETLPAARLAARIRDHGIALHAARRFDEAEAAYAEALARLDAVDSAEARRAALGVVRNLALLRYETGDIAEAIAIQRQALARARREHDSDDVEAVRIEANLAQFIANFGDLDAGIARLEDALRRLRAALGPDHPDVVGIRGALGGLLIERGDVDRGAPLLAGSIEDALARSAPGSPAYALHLGYRGWLRLQQGRLEEAADDLTAAIAIAERLPVANDLNRVGMLEALGQVRLAQGRPEEALAIFERMAEAEAAGGRAMRLDFGQRTLRRAEALIALGRCADASPWIDRAAALAVQRTSANHPLRVRIAAARARCEAMGARREADGRTPPGIAAPSPRPAESGIRHGSPQRLSP